MNNCRLVLFLSLIGQLCLATSFKLEFVVPRDLKVQLSLFEVNKIQFEKAVGTHGELITNEQLGDAKPIKNFSVDLGPADGKVLALIAENKSDVDIDFFVSPHESNPSEFSLDFKFNCLCYAHIYKVKSKKKWYRIMKLQHLDEKIPAKTIRLKHTLVKWTGSERH